MSEMQQQTEQKTILEKQFQELVEMARRLYPDIDEAVSTLNNMTAQTTSLQDYLNLTLQTPTEITNNQIFFA